MKYLFGPVPSRRLGRSLGVDLVPFKTCSYDCIYCQLGRTTHKTTRRKQWVPFNGVLAELEEGLSRRPDYITLSGLGEPTLFSRAGELIKCIKVMTNVPVAVLTNGSLLWHPMVRAELLNADLVIPSLDAGDDALFQTINRPHRGISFNQMLRGLMDFRRAFNGEYWLEVFLLAGYTAIESEVAKLAACVEKIRPDRVQLNTVTRPPTEDFTISVQREYMDRAAAMFSPRAEVIADYSGIHQEHEFSAGRIEILDMLHRRPCSIEDITAGLGLHRNEVIKHIEELAARDLVDSSEVNGVLYYRAEKRHRIRVSNREAKHPVRCEKKG